MTSFDLQFNQLPAQLAQLAQLFRDAGVRKPRPDTMVTLYVSNAPATIVQSYRHEKYHAKVAATIDTSWNGSDGEWNSQVTHVCASSLALSVDKSYNRFQKYWYGVHIGNVGADILARLREQVALMRQPHYVSAVVEILPVVVDSALENEPEVYEVKRGE